MLVLIKEETFFLKAQGWFRIVCPLFIRVQMLYFSLISGLVVVQYQIGHMGTVSLSNAHSCLLPYRIQPPQSYQSNDSQCSTSALIMVSNVITTSE